MSASVSPPWRTLQARGTVHAAIPLLETFCDHEHHDIDITDRQHAEGSQAEVWPHRRPERRPPYVCPPAVPSTPAILHRPDSESSEWMLIRTTEVTPRTPAPRISRRKGFLSKRTAFVREITREVAGYVTLRISARGEAMAVQ